MCYALLFVVVFVSFLCFFLIIEQFVIVKNAVLFNLHRRLFLSRATWRCLIEKLIDHCLVLQQNPRRLRKFSFFLFGCIELSIPQIFRKQEIQM